MNIGWQGLIIIVVVLVLIIGVTRIPDLLRSMHQAQQEHRQDARRSGPARSHPEDVNGSRQT